MYGERGWKDFSSEKSFIVLTNKHGCHEIPLFGTCVCLKDWETVMYLIFFNHYFRMCLSLDLVLGSMSCYTRKVWTPEETRRVQEPIAEVRNRRNKITMQVNCKTTPTFMRKLRENVLKFDREKFLAEGEWGKESQRGE